MSETTNDCERALNKLRESDDLSPNQRRIIMVPLQRLINYASAYVKVLPSNTGIRIAQYCSAVQIALYTTAYFELPIWQHYAFNRIVNGESLRNLSKELKAKENVLRETILDAAWYIYRIAECVCEVSAPKGIPDLRNAVWKPFADNNQFFGIVRRATNEWLIPFENATGITLIDYKRFRQTLIDIDKKHMAA